MARFALGALAFALAACGGADAPGETRPEPPGRPAVDSSAPATLQVPDTIRFGGQGQNIVPEIRLLDLRGRPLDPARVQWRPRNDSIVGVWQPAGYIARLIASRPGATWVIATVPRAEGAALVDSTWAVWAPVFERLWITTMQYNLLMGQTSQVRAVLIDTSEAMHPIPDSLSGRVVWSSDRPEVARVDAQGRVTAVAPGNAILTMTIPPLGFRDTTLVGVARVADIPFASWRDPWMCAGSNCQMASPDGETLFIHSQGYRDGSIGAFSADGQLLWTRPADRNPTLRAVGRDGTLYYERSGLHAVRRDGADRWTAPCTGAVALGSDDTVYCADSSAIYAVSPAGTVLWRRERQGVVRLAVTEQGRIYSVEYVYRRGSMLAGLARDGTVLWERDPGDGPMSLAVDAEGTLYLSYFGYRTEAVAPDGTVRWVIPGVRGELAIGPDRTLIMAREYGLVTAFRQSDGRERWSTRDFTIDHGAPYVSSSGRLYVATGCFVHTLDARTGAVLGRTSEGRCTGYLPYLFVPGRLYLGGSYYRLPAGEGPGSEWAQPGGDAGRSWRPGSDRPPLSQRSRTAPP